AGGMRPAARRRMADPMLLRQRQRHAALLQGRGAAAAWQGRLERGELRRQVKPRWRWLTQRRWARRWVARGCRRWLVRPLCPLRAGWRPWESCLALLLLTPLRTRRFHIAPG